MKYNKVQISNQLLSQAVASHVANYDKSKAGGDYDYKSCSIADLEAEYIRLPTSE